MPDAHTTRQPNHPSTRTCVCSHVAPFCKHHRSSCSSGDSCGVSTWPLEATLTAHPCIHNSMRLGPCAHAVLRVLSPALLLCSTQDNSTAACCASCRETAQRHHAKLKGYNGQAPSKHRLQTARFSARRPGFCPVFPFSVTLLPLEMAMLTSEYIIPGPQQQPSADRHSALAPRQGLSHSVSTVLLHCFPNKFPAPALSAPNGHSSVSHSVQRVSANAAPTNPGLQT